MHHAFRLSEPGSPEITVDHSQLTGLRVSVAGERLPRLRQGGRPAFTIPMADGTTRQISIGGQLTGLQVYVDDGTTIALERKLSLWELVLVVLPIGLLGVAGLAGGLTGLIAIGANLRLVRMPWSPVVRVVAMIVSLLLALAASVLVAAVMSRFPVAP